MFVLITYDVNVASLQGQRRLNKVAKICLDYGQRVQNSVFECVLTESDFLILKDKLIKTIDKDLDSIRFYRISGNWERKIDSIGRKTAILHSRPNITRQDS